jgi:hypothetical protein
MTRRARVGSLTPRQSNRRAAPKRSRASRGRRDHERRLNRVGDVVAVPRRQHRRNAGKRQATAGDTGKRQATPGGGVQGGEGWGLARAGSATAAVGDSAPRAAPRSTAAPRIAPFFFFSFSFVCRSSRARLARARRSGASCVTRPRRDRRRAAIPKEGGRRASRTNGDRAFDQRPREVAGARRIR